MSGRNQRASLVDAVSGKLSRQDIETLCILDAVGEAGSSGAGLTGRLGLAVGLAPAMAVALGELRDLGWLEEREGTFHLTAEGRSWLVERLAVVGLPRT